MEVLYRPELSVQTLLMDANSVQETAENLARDVLWSGLRIKYQL